MPGNAVASWRISAAKSSSAKRPNSAAKARAPSTDRTVDLRERDRGDRPGPHTRCADACGADQLPAAVANRQQAPRLVYAPSACDAADLPVVDRGSLDRDAADRARVA